MLYGGITVGPIIETMGMTSTPAGLWFASYFFSVAVRDICKELVQQGKEILTLPENYSFEEHEEDNGIGSYHDRIYFKAETDLDAARADVFQAIASSLDKRAGEMSEAFSHKVSSEDLKKYLKTFLQTHFVVFDESSAIKEKGIAKTLADALDALELSQHSKMMQESAHIRRLIRGTQADGNAYLRHFPVLVKEAGNELFPLAYKKEGSIRIKSLSEISAGRELSEQEEKKLHKTDRYFAIVQCDGDSMGQTIASDEEKGNLEQQEKRIRRFSSLCMKYTTSSAKMVTEYGGVVIYAGGDDLLFLAPILSKNENCNSLDIWDLCRAIGKNFDEIFKAADSKRKPSISIGLSIQYRKFPLYEAFNDARGLLFGTAKNFSTDYKNNLAVHLRKSSGQSVALTCRMETRASADVHYGVYDEYIDFIHKFFVQNAKRADESNQLMHSVIYHLENHHALFQTALEDGSADSIKHAFQNMFDNDGQSFGTAMLDELAKLAVVTHKAVQGGAIDTYRNDDGDSEGNTDESSEKGTASNKKVDSLSCLTSMLRLAKFMVEEG